MNIRPTKIQQYPIPQNKFGQILMMKQRKLNSMIQNNKLPLSNLMINFNYAYASIYLQILQTKQEIILIVQMMLGAFFKCAFGTSHLSENLKLLNLKIPTTQQQIKSKYRQLAKQFHPDTLKQKSSDASSKKSENHFVQITTAYNFLKQVDEKQLSAQVEDYDINMEDGKREKVKTKEEELRQQTYDYFRKKDFYAQKKKDPMNQKPLYKTVPELFIGAAFVVVIFGEWFYKTVLKTDKEFKQVQNIREDLTYSNVFKGLNSARRFSNNTLGSKEQQRHPVEMMSENQSNNL